MPCPVQQIFSLDLFTNMTVIIYSHIRTLIIKRLKSFFCVSLRIFGFNFNCRTFSTQADYILMEELMVDKAAAFGYNSDGFLRSVFVFCCSFMVVTVILSFRYCAFVIS